jgi:hypothetical protein
MWIVGGLLLAALLIIGWVIAPALRRRYAFKVPNYPPANSAPAPALFKPRTAPVTPKKNALPGNGFVGGPRQISVQLTASKPSLRHGGTPSAKLSGSVVGTGRLKPQPPRDSGYEMQEPNREMSLTASDAEAAVGPVIEQGTENGESLHGDSLQTTEIAEVSALSELPELTAGDPEPLAEIPESVERPASVEQIEEITWPAYEAGNAFDGAKESSSFERELSDETSQSTETAAPALVGLSELPLEAISIEQSVSDQTPSTVIPTPVLAKAAFAEPEFSQTKTPAIMPETTQTPTAPVNKAPAPPMAKPQQPSAAMQTSVQLTFSFEIAAMQLTPSFKMGALKVRPISKLVTMRLPSPQQPQSALNLQVGFEVAKIQPAAGALGRIRMVPSQQQRPAPGGLPSFSVAGLQVVPNSETAPVQLTPSQQGRASVLVTVPFQITTLEFAPSLEIASVILNSNSKQVAVQLPGAGPLPTEGAPMFEIANLELGEGGDIAMMHLNPVSAPKRA